MKFTKFKLKTLLIFFMATVMPIIIFFALVYILSSGENSVTADLNTYIKFGAISAIIFSLFLFLICYYHVNKIWTKVLREIRQGILSIQSGDFEYKISFPESEEFIELEDTYKGMTKKLKENNKELELQALQIYKKNIEIQQNNIELEASYGQLQATINQLNDSELKYYSLVKNITDIVCVIRLDGSIYFINDMVKEVLGYSRQEVEGKNIKELIKPDISEDFFEKVSKGLKMKNSLMLELELVTKDGLIVLSEATLTNFIYDGEIIGLQAILRDITQKKKMEQEIIASYKEMATINSLSRKLNATLEIQHVLKLVVNEIYRVLKVPFCSLRLLDKKEESFIPMAYSGEYTVEAVKSINDFPKYNLSDPLFSKMFEANDYVISHDFNKFSLIKKINSAIKSNEKIKEILLVPIKTKDKKIGILSIGVIGNFSSRQKSLVSSIANNAAIAIENASLYDASRRSFIKTVNALIAAIEAKDKYTEGHSHRVSRYAAIIAEKIGLSKEQIDEIRVAGILHDIGKIGVPDAILSKPYRLTQDEYEQIKKHPTISNKILEPVELAKGTMKAIAHHHERWDGRGYPFGISNEYISIEAQIIAVADALDAMTSDRAYRKAMTEEDAVKEILKGRDTQFSPIVVDIVTELFKSSKIGIFNQ